MLSKWSTLLLACILLEWKTSLGEIDIALSSRRFSHGPRGKCILPPKPEHGSFNMTAGSMIEGRATFIKLLYSCDQGYEMVGEPSVFCWGGVWNALVMPKCVRGCKLTKHPSIDYNCIISGSDTRRCEELEVEGTVIKPTCNRPYYYSPLELPPMVCEQGKWTASSICLPECGLFTEEMENGVVPWQAAIYFKGKVGGRHDHICSGTLISNSVVLTAASCFWDDDLKKIKDETYYAVAVGKLHSAWDHVEKHAQKSEVKKIIVPEEYQGPASNIGDIAVVVVSKAFDYALRVRPACLDFKRDVLESQLVSGNFGKSTIWTTGGNGVANKTKLKSVDLPFVSVGDCATEEMGVEKFCAGDSDGPQLCGKNTGSGVTFTATIDNTPRQYLRGIATGCAAPTTFTSIAKYRRLIKNYWFN